MSKSEEYRIQQRSKKIGVLMGGWSDEREISLKTGKAIAGALNSKGWQVVEIDVDRDICMKIIKKPRNRWLPF